MMVVGLGTWSLARAALIILLLPRSECGRVGAVVRGELPGEIAGLEERSMSLRCHTAPGDPRESQENEAGPQMWGGWAPITDFTMRNGEGTRAGQPGKGWGSGLFLQPLPGCQRNLWLLCNLHNKGIGQVSSWNKEGQAEPSYSANCRER